MSVDSWCWKPALKGPISEFFLQTCMDEALPPYFSHGAEAVQPLTPSSRKD